MNHFFNRKIAKQSEIILDVVFLLMHLWFLFYFYMLGVDIMFYANIVSVLIYVLGYFMIAKELLIPFYYISAVEIVVHMTMACVCVGVAPGFQWALLVLPVEFFFCDFFSLQIRGRTALARTGSFMAIGMLLGLEFYMRGRKPLYELEEWVCFYSRIALIVVMFILAFFLLRILTKFSYLTNRKLHEKAATDGLTGLTSRFEAMDQLDLYAQRKELSNAWVAIIDLDNFKKINDFFGYGIGDHVLMEVADVLRAMPQELICARWGGDDFLVVGRSYENEQAVIEQMEQVRSKMQEVEFAMFDDSVNVDATIGIAFYKEGESIKDWINNADKKLHAGKYNGKSRVIV